MTAASTLASALEASRSNRRQSGVLLLNLGTPDAPRTPEVRRYLRQFLSDPRVLDLPALSRALLLHLVILPFRSPRSAKAYRQIWTERGSPLLVHGEDLRNVVEERLRPIPVALGMRYGKPSIASAISELHSKKVDRIVVFPLYPQEASASTGTALEEVYREAGQPWNVPDVVTIPPFYDHPGFIEALAEVGRPHLERAKADHVIFSYHGLPERHVQKADSSGSHCLSSPTCCAALLEVNRRCYRAQCFATSRLLGEALDLTPDRFTIAFQSRLGRDPWIQPHTDVLLREFPRRGIRRLAIFCPAFVADCLETLEEIGIRGRESFLAAGGDAFTLIPSLNTHPRWVDTVVSLVQAALH